MGQSVKRHGAGQGTALPVSAVAGGLPELFSAHFLGVEVVTDLLKQDVPREDVKYLAGHSEDDPDSRSPAQAGDAEYRGADFDLSGCAPGRLDQPFQFGRW